MDGIKFISIQTAKSDFMRAISERTDLTPAQVAQAEAAFDRQPPGTLRTEDPRRLVSSIVEDIVEPIETKNVKITRTRYLGYIG